LRLLHPWRCCKNAAISPDASIDHHRQRPHGLGYLAQRPPTYNDNRTCQSENDGHIDPRRRLIPRKTKRCLHKEDSGHKRKTNEADQIAAGNAFGGPHGHVSSWHFPVPLARGGSPFRPRTPLRCRISCALVCPWSSSRLFILGHQLDIKCGHRRADYPLLSPPRARARKTLGL